MALKTTLPLDLADRLSDLEEAIAASCPDVLFVYPFGSAATNTLTPRRAVVLKQTTSGNDLVLLRLGATRRTEPLLQTPARENDPDIAPGATARSSPPPIVVVANWLQQRKARTQPR